MTKSTNQRRTAASVVEIIRESVEEERKAVRVAEAEVSIRRARFEVLQQILAAAEKDRSDDEQ